MVQRHDFKQYNNLQKVVFLPKIDIMQKKTNISVDDIFRSSERYVLYISPQDCVKVNKRKNPRNLSSIYFFLLFS